MLGHIWLALLGVLVVTAVHLWRAGMLLPSFLCAGILGALWAAWLWLDIPKR